MVVADRRLWQRAAHIIHKNHRVIVMDSGSSAHFWYDVWTGNTPLKDYLPDDIWTTMFDKNCTIQQAFSDPMSNQLQMAFWHCPMNLFTKFLTTYNSQDTWIWCPTQDGHFSTKSVRSILTTEANQQWAILWAPYIPTKWSVLIWRIILNAVPIDGTVKEQGIPLVSKCYCCSNPHEETTLHLFFKSAIAVQIWTELAHLLHFSHADMTSIADNLTDFLASREPEAVAARLIRCTFMSILWEIWCSRNKARFQDQGMSAKHIINRSLFSVRAICTSYKFQKIPPDWIAALCQDSTVKDNLNARIPSAVRWFTPLSGRLKLNVDGAFKSTSGEAGGGGIVPDQNGNMLCAFAHAYHGLNSSLAAEALAMRDGISMCCRNGISKVMIETDSHNLVQIMTAQQACQWDLVCILQDITAKTQILQAEISHTPCEANRVADSLANFVLFCPSLVS
ncbi:hypothetical protein Taro_018726 [Colocasia esculenta]|uniref:RNase H type-1 domain-containing protein n=1 Tax=Colocasia esculenta TaxID=4460 RepID=A0A843UUJ3_COLES|nr:hypothetical protein [Colocasia esculenta]